MRLLPEQEVIRFLEAQGFEHLGIPNEPFFDAQRVGPVIGVIPGGPRFDRDVLARDPRKIYDLPNLCFFPETSYVERYVVDGCLYLRVPRPCGEFYRLSEWGGWPRLRKVGESRVKLNYRAPDEFFFEAASRTISFK